MRCTGTKHDVVCWIYTIYKYVLDITVVTQPMGHAGTKYWSVVCIVQLYHCTTHSDQWGNWGMARLNGAFEIAHCITKEPRQLKQIPCNRNAQFGIVRATMHCNGSEPMFQRFDLHVYYCAHHYYRITSDKRLLSTFTSISPPPVFYAHHLCPFCHSLCSKFKLGATCQI